MHIRVLRILLLLSFSWPVLGQVRDIHYFLAQGFDNNPVLKDYRNQLLLNAADSALFNAQRKPSVTAITELMYPPVYKGYGYDEVITDGGNYQSVVRATQPILNRKNNAAQMQKIGIDGLSVSNSLELAAKGLKHDIISSYINACASYEQINADRSLLALLNQQGEWMKQMIQQGIMTQTSYMSFLLETQDMIMRVREDRMQYIMNLGELNGLCGINDTSYVLLVTPQIVSDTNDIKNPNPFLQQFILDSLRNINALALIDNSYRPTIGWMADAGFLTSRPEYVYKHFGLSMGMSLSIPIYDGHQRNISYSKIRIQEDTRQQYRQYFILQRQVELARLKKELEETEKSILMYSSQKETTSAMIEAARDLLNSGNMNITEYLLMITNYREIGSILNQTIFKKMHLVNEINYLRW
jgi:hypothetical protein